MPKTLAIFGVGPGMSRSVANRFGREGFRLALVARNLDKLEKYVQELAANGIEAAAFTADVTDRGELVRVIGEINERFGHIDVAQFSPSNLDTPVVNVLDVDPDDLPAQFQMPLWAPIALVKALLPGMIERRDGTILLGSGVSAVRPVPALGNVGIALGGLRQYVQNLNAAVADKGVYVGVIHVGGLIDRSDASKIFEKHAPADIGPVPRVNPDELAETAWEMHANRDTFERIVGSYAQ
ncbi:SDR family NAD(P)-dependent oxidoreductase [Fodinicola feengrottensis]|uniref:SDR family NAD(P)-dependent oxidoreductase n=1 Tax=Fodinicola feengrottensis TaxID=435914 RepID=A0ABP4TRJ0_9ACTN